MYTVWDKFMKYNPADPKWFNRDRFILSPGHGSALLYAMLHLAGYDLTIDDLKNFRQWGSKTPGHPEYGVTAGVDVSTGPLGHGLSMGVGFALAESMLPKRMAAMGSYILIWPDKVYYNTLDVDTKNYHYSHTNDFGYDGAPLKEATATKTAVFDCHALPYSAYGTDFSRHSGYSNAFFSGWANINMESKVWSGFYIDLSQVRAESVSGTPAVTAEGLVVFGTDKGSFCIIKPDPATKGAELLAKADITALVKEAGMPFDAAFESPNIKMWSGVTIGDDGKMYVGFQKADMETESGVLCLTSSAVKGPGTGPWPMFGVDRKHTGVQK